MKQVFEFPPNYEELKGHFSLGHGVLFCYGDVLYNPHKTTIDRHIILHEEVHSKEQKRMGIKKWWRRFIDDPAFRVKQEQEAYRAQYRSVRGIARNPASLQQFARALAESLSGPTYGSCITFGDALKFITS